MRWTIAWVLLVVSAASADAFVLYQQPPRATGGFYHSSWWDPDGSNYDEYVWDRFSIAGGATIESISWRGAYDSAYGGDTPVRDFTVAIYASIIGGSQPDVSHPPLVEYTVGSNAGETYAGVFGGVAMYDYSFTLPTGFQAQPGVLYWLQIEGWQWGFPGWSWAAGTGGDNYHFRCQHNNLNNPSLDGVPTGCWFTAPSGDAAFTLNGSIPAGAEDAQASSPLSLSGPTPNPSRGDRVDVTIHLASDGPAMLELFDVAGRCVVSMDLSALGAGEHVVSMTIGAPIGPGFYLARLRQGIDRRLIKVIIVG